VTIRLAETAGFCFGVGRAVELAQQAAREGSCVMLGPLIHNVQVTGMLEAQGVHMVETPAQTPPDTRLIVRAHGAPQALYTELETLGIPCVDATCPFVKKIHRIVKQQADEKRQIIIMGNADHPEVRGICGWCTDALVFSCWEECHDWLVSHQIPHVLPISVVAQTTTNKKKWEKFVNSIKQLYTNVKIFDTICNATEERQTEAEQLARNSDVMIVIGDRSSSNTQKLAEISSAYAKTFLIESASQLPLQEIIDAGRIGITAGASTPSWIIKEVVNKMSEELKKDVILEETNEIEESFEDLLNQTFKTLYTGEKVTGEVTAILPNEIQVDLGVKQAGYIPLTELSDDPQFKVDSIHVGDQIEACVTRVNDVEGMIMLSKKRLDAVKMWDDVEAAREDKTILEGVVVEENKGGIVVNVKGVRVFVPASQTGLPKDAPLADMIKQTVRLRITEVNRARRRVVGTIRAVQMEEKHARAEAVWETIEEGKAYAGTVKSLTNYGAFVDIGGVDGMIHISELSWNRVKHPSEVLNVGDEVEVYVISLDREKKKISLGYRKAEDNPWTKFRSAYEIGSVASVKVLKFMPFGAFAEILPGVDGLIHISQIADHRIAKPDDVLSEGQVVDAKIVDIDDEKKKISLSIRALLEENEEPAADEE